MTSRTPNMPDYQQVKASFHWDVPEYYNFATDVIDRWAEDRTKLALVWVDDAGRERRVTYWELSRESRRAARLLSSMGVQQGDPVLVVMQRLPEWWALLFGLFRLGAIPMPGTTQLTPKDIRYRVQMAGARAAIVDADNASKVDEVRADCPTLSAFLVVRSPDDEVAPSGWRDYHQAIGGMKPHFEGPRTRAEDGALIYFTSGTSGHPKMVLHTHASYPFGHQVTGKYWLDLTPYDLHWNLSDTGWAKAAWSSVFGPLSQGAAVFIHNAKGKFDSRRTLQLLERYGVTTFCAPPTAYRMMVQENLKGYDLSELRHAVGAGEPLNPEVIAMWREGTGLTIRDGYGQTESVLVVGNFPTMAVKPGSMGLPSPGFDVSVIDNDGNELPPGKEGDIAIRVKPERPVGLFKEYWKDPEGTRARLLGDWYITGDRAYKDEDGYLWFVGRADDVIISAGYRIGPFEVESALVEHDAVLEAAVVASPDPVRGEVVKAFVTLTPGYQPSDELARELQDYVKSSTAPYKYPREIEFVPELPKTISGKIRRVELREREQQRKTGD